MPRTRVGIGQGPLLGEDSSVDPDPSVDGPCAPDHIDGDDHEVGEDDPEDWAFPLIKARLTQSSSELIFSHNNYSPSP